MQFNAYNRNKAPIIFEFDLIITCLFQYFFVNRRLLFNPILKITPGGYGILSQWLLFHLQPNMHLKTAAQNQKYFPHLPKAKPRLQ